MKLLQTVATNLRYFRKCANLTQEVLAWKSKLSPDYISRVERGEDNISIATLEKIAKVLKIEAFKLLVPRIDRVDVQLVERKEP